MTHEELSPDPSRIPYKGLILQESTNPPNHMEDTFWTEIADAPGEIFDMDIPELRDDEDEQTWNEFVNSNVTL